MTNTKMKFCPCGSPGPFYRNASRPDGLSFYCKACTARQRREEYARKYPNGRNGGNAARLARLRESMKGNKLHEMDGFFSGQKDRYRPREKALHAPDSREPGVRKEYDTGHLDGIIRMSLT